jgi:hypothetical protein
MKLRGDCDRFISIIINIITKNTENRLHKKDEGNI